MKIARKLRDDLLARYTEMCRKPNGIKAFQTMSVTETGVFQDRLVMTASISLRILFCCAAFRAVGFGKRRRGTPDPALS